MQEEGGAQDKLSSFIMQAAGGEFGAGGRWGRGGGGVGSRTTRSSHLHLQHLLEDGLGQTFPGVSLVAPLDQLVFVFLVRNNASTAGDLTVTKRTRTTRLTGVSV